MVTLKLDLRPSLLPNRELWLREIAYQPSKPLLLPTVLLLDIPKPQYLRLSSPWRLTSNASALYLALSPAHISVSLSLYKHCWHGVKGL